MRGLGPAITGSTCDSSCLYSHPQPELLQAPPPQSSLRCSSHTEPLAHGAEPGVPAVGHTPRSSHGTRPRPTRQPAFCSELPLVTPTFGLHAGPRLHLSPRQPAWSGYPPPPLLPPTGRPPATRAPLLSAEFVFLSDSGTFLGTDVRGSLSGVGAASKELLGPVAAALTLQPRRLAWPQAWKTHSSTMCRLHT